MRREAFVMPVGVYLDGNSLGPLPHAAKACVARRLGEWAEAGVSAWEGWFALAEGLSPKLAQLVGAKPGEVIATGSITANLHALLATFYRPSGARRQLLATALDFPTDLYALRAWAEREGAELNLIPSSDGFTLETDDILAALTDKVAFALLPTVLYRSGQRLDVPRITAAAHEAGIIIGWDAAHSIGAMPHAFHDDKVDVAVWCHYKYVNAGPGAPGGLFVHERHHHRTPGLPGWWGHDKTTQFDMAPHFTPAPGAGAYQMGTPSILGLAGLEGALTVFDDLDLTEVRTRSLALTDHLLALIDQHLPECTLRTPRVHATRGGHVVLEHPEAKALSVALRQRGVVPDYRPPNLLRLAPVALYTTEGELEQAVRVLRELLDTRTYHERGTTARVT